MNFATWFDGMQDLLEKSPQLPASKAQLLMIEKYHEGFGIANYQTEEANQRPLMHVAMHPAEDPITGSLLVETFKRFSDLDIGAVFNISIDQFLNCTHDHCELMFEIVEQRRERELKAIQDNINKASRDEAAARQASQQPQIIIAQN